MVQLRVLQRMTVQWDDFYDALTLENKWALDRYRAGDRTQVARLASRDHQPAEDVLYGQAGKTKPVSRIPLNTLPKEETANMLRQCQIDGEPEEEIEAIYQDIGMNPPFG